MELASYPGRLIAWLIDGFILSFITGIIFRVFGTPYLGSASALLLVELVLYHGYFWTHYNGQTPGKMLAGIRVVKKDGSAMLWADTVVRCLGYVVNSVLLNLGWLWILVDAERQGIHDKLAQTCVVRVAPRAKNNMRS
ncbi:MAG: RDD family protein [Anaerolineae bacterium]